MKIVFTFVTSIMLIFCFYLSFPSNNPSKYLQNIAVLVEDMGGSGSGLVIIHKEETYILTCAHVLTNLLGMYMPVNVIQEVRQDNKLIKRYTYLAEPFRVDIKNDIAILKVKQKTHFKNSIRIDRHAFINVGEEIWMIGSPYGYNCYNNITKGIVSRYDYGDIIRYQVDCSIYQGGSGGGMFDEHGRFYGMLCSMRNPTLGYCIPSQTIRLFLKKECPELLK